MEESETASDEESELEDMAERSKRMVTDTEESEVDSDEESELESEIDDDEESELERSKRMVTDMEEFEVDSDEESELERSKRMVKDSYGNNKKDDYKYPGPPGYCDCCKPRICKPRLDFDSKTCSCVCRRRKCPLGLTFNPKTCQCECPKGTYLDRKRLRCVGM